METHGFSSSTVGLHIDSDGSHPARHLPCANCVYVMRRLQMNAVDYTVIIRAIPDSYGKMTISILKWLELIVNAPFGG